MTTIAIALMSLAGAVVLVLLALALVLHIAANTPVDRDEDGEEADERVRQVRDSMRGTL